MPIPTYGEIIKLIKTGATIEAQEKIMELREGALELQEENLRLRTQLQLMESELKQQKARKFERGLYWTEGDSVPFCPQCLETSQKLVHLSGPLPVNPNAPNYEAYECHSCHNDYFAQKGDSFRPALNRARILQSKRP